MKRFLLWCFLFLLFVFCVLRIIDLFLPYYYGNVLYAEKIDYFNQHESEYNSVIFGSSRMYRQVIPDVLDSQLNDLNIRSYNLATPAAYNPESYYLFEEFFNRIDSGEIKIAIMELQGLNNLSESNLHTNKGNYWNSCATLQYVLDYISESDLRDDQKKRVSWNYVKSFAIRILSFDKLKYFIDYLSHQQMELIGIHGFYSLQTHLSNSHMFSLVDIHNKLLQDTNELTTRKLESLKLDQPNGSPYFNRTHFRKLTCMLDLATRKGVRLFFVVPPKLPVYHEIIPILSELPDDVIVLANGIRYPEFYLLKNSFDIGHLNDKGAMLLSEYLGRELKFQIQNSHVGTNAQK